MMNRYLIQIPANGEVASWILAILTGVLVAVTTYYAWETRNIRKEAQMMREIAKKPIFSFEIDDSHCSEGNPAITQSLYLINYGPLARDIQIKTKHEIDGETKNEKERFLIAMATNQKIEILGNYCNIKHKKGKITTNIVFKDVDMKLYEKEEPLVIDFNQSSDSFFTIPYSVESKDRMAILRALTKK
jgi:hypothetical protein